MRQYRLQFEQRSLPQQRLPKRKLLRGLSSEPRNIGAELDSRPERAWVVHSSQEVVTAWTTEDIVAVPGVWIVDAAVDVAVPEEKCPDLLCDPNLFSIDLLSEAYPGQRPLQELPPFPQCRQ